MALIKIKQVSGLQADLNLKMVQADLDNLSVDSKDASVLAAAGADAGDQIIAASIDSKDASVLAAAGNYTDTELGNYDTTTVVNSKDASVLAAAGNYTDTQLGSYDLTTSVDSKDASVLAAASADAGDQITAVSIDSKDASVLAAAENYTDTQLGSYDLTTSVDSKDASVLAAANAYTDALEADLHAYEEVQAGISGPNNGTYVVPAAGDFDVTTGDFEVYVNGLRIEKLGYNVAGGVITFDPAFVGYDVETADEVKIAGHVA